MPLASKVSVPARVLRLLWNRPDICLFQQFPQCVWSLAKISTRITHAIVQYGKTTLISMFNKILGPQAIFCDMAPQFFIIVVGCVGQRSGFDAKAIKLRKTRVNFPQPCVNRRITVISDIGQPVPVPSNLFAG
jgi:hypothetical protein